MARFTRKLMRVSRQYAKLEELVQKPAFPSIIGMKATALKKCLGMSTEERAATAKDAILEAYDSHKETMKIWKDAGEAKHTKEVMMALESYKDSAKRDVKCAEKMMKGYKEGERPQEVLADVIAYCTRARMAAHRARDVYDKMCRVNTRCL
jgi:hypothetical protein